MTFPSRSGPFPRLSVGKDELAGISDDRQLLCLALALWNGKAPFLKERLFVTSRSPSPDDGNSRDSFSAQVWIAP